MRTDGATSDRSPLPLVAAALLVVGGATLILAGSGSESSPGTGVWPGSGAAATGALDQLAQPSPPAAATPVQLAAWEARAAPRRGQPDESTEPPPDLDTAVKESEFYTAYMQLAARDPEAFLFRARQTLEATGVVDGPPECEGVALLRAAYAACPEQAAELCVQAARLPSRAGSRGSLPEFAVRCLGERAGSDPLARTALETLAFGSAPPTPGLRRRAASSFAVHADASQLGRLGGRLAREPDPLLVEGVLASLARHPERPGVDPILAAYGRWPAPASDDEQEP